MEKECTTRRTRGFVTLMAILALTGLLPWARGATTDPPSSPKGDQSTPNRIIEAAKKEGTVVATLKAELKGGGVEQIKGGIKQKYGVTLDIRMQPTGGYGRDLANAITEHQGGLPPTYDLMTFSTPLMPRIISSGIAEKVDWKPLLVQGAPAGVIQHGGYGLMEYSAYIGLMYNPLKVPENEVPKSFLDLADPKGRRRIYLLENLDTWANYAFARGIDRTLSDLRSIMKNEPLIGRYADGFNRYSTGEIDLALISSAYLLIALDKGLPAKWRSLDVSWPSYHQMIIRKGAAHPSAARLLAVFIAGPDGYEIMRKYGIAGNLFYPGNPEWEIREADQKAGLPVYFAPDWPGAMEFLKSKQAADLRKQLQQILSR